MPNFNIIEGEDILDTIQDDFLRMYFDENYQVKDICEKLGISRSQFQNLRMRLVRQGVIEQVRNNRTGRKKVPARYSKKNPKNYYYDKAHKMFHAKYREEYYGCFKTEDEVKRFVELMRECDWDKSRRHELKKKVLEGG